MIKGLIVSLTLMSSIAGAADSFTSSGIDDSGYAATSQLYVAHETVVFDDVNVRYDIASSAAAKTNFGENFAGTSASLWTGGSATATSIWADRFSYGASELSISVLLSINTWSGGSGSTEYDLVMYKTEMTEQQLVSAIDAKSDSLTFLISKNYGSTFAFSRNISVTTVVDNDFYLASILRSSTVGYGSAYSSANFAIQTTGIISSSGTEYPSSPIPEPNQYAMLALGIFALTATKLIKLSKHG